MNVTKYYKNSVVVPSLLIITVYVISAIFLALYNDFKEGWLQSQSSMVNPVVMALPHAVIICILALPVFLNHFSKIRSNPEVRMITWFLLPGIYFCYVWIMKSPYILNEDSVSELDYIYLLSVTLPYIISLIVNYIKFKNEMGIEQKKSLS